MNEKYIIGAAIGFAAAWVLLNNQTPATPPVKAPPAKQKIPPARLPSGSAQPAFAGLGGRIGWRPWGYGRMSIKAS